MDLPPTLAGVRETRQDHPRSSYSSEPVTPSRASSDSNLVGKNNQLVSSCTTFELGFYVACVMSFWRKTTLPIHPQVHSAIPVDDQVNTVRRLAKRAWVEGVNRHRVTLSLSPFFHHCPCAASEKEKVCILQDTGYGDKSNPRTTSFPLALITMSSFLNEPCQRQGLKRPERAGMAPAITLSNARPCPR